MFINMPEWFNSSELLEYFFYYRNRTLTNFSIEVKKLLQMGFFFQNEPLVRVIVKKEVIPNLNKENALVYLNESYNKLSCNSQNLDQVWFDLFVVCLDFVSKNFLYYMNIQYETLLEANSLLLEEIIEK